MKALALAALILSTPASAVELHYAPAENLEAIDVEQINSAERSIDFAAYVLSDWVVMDALKDAADRGVMVRIYLDGSQAARAEPDAGSAYGKLLVAAHVEVKQKRAGRPIQHLKSYCVDGHIFRTGSANFSASGLKHQDNDLMLFDDPKLCAAFEADFTAMWTGRDAE